MVVSREQRAHGLREWLGVAVVVLGVLGGTAARAMAEGGPDCRLELAEQPTKSGKTLIVQVRLVHVPDGKLMTGATVTALRFDMGPAGMAAMSAPANAVASSTPGIYVVEARPSMPGNWALRLRATLPNHAPVEVALVIASQE